MGQWIRIRSNSINRLWKSEEMVSVGEMYKLTENCISVSDKALFHCFMIQDVDSGRY